MHDTETLTLLQDVDKAIKYYRDMKNKTENIGQLIQLYERLAGYSAYLRMQVGEYKEQHKYNYASRKFDRTKKMHELSKAAREAGSKFVVSKAEIEADYETVEILAEEVKAEGYAERLHNTVLAIRDIMNAIELRRNHYKSEKQETNSRNITQ